MFCTDYSETKLYFPHAMMCIQRIVNVVLIQSLFNCVYQTQSQFREEN